jgi:hypothetical protein
MAFDDLQGSPTAGAAGTDSVIVLGEVPELPEAAQQGWQAAKCSLVSPTLMSGATATAVTFSFGYSRAGAAVVPIGSYVTILGADLPVETEKQATLVAAANALQAGDVLVLTTSHATTGIAIPANVIAKVELHYGQ